MRFGRLGKSVFLLTDAVAMVLRAKSRDPLETIPCLRARGRPACLRTMGAATGVFWQ